MRKLGRGPIGYSLATSAQLGFDRQRWTDLKNELQRFASLDAHPTIDTRFGQKYVVRGTIRGSRGRLASVAVVQIYAAEAVEVEFVTASGRTRALLTLPVGDVRGVQDDDLLAVRTAPPDGQADTPLS